MAPRRARGGLSVQEKSQIRDTIETVERMKESQKKIEHGLKLLNLNEFRQRMDNLESGQEQRALKTEVGDKFVEVMKNIQELA